jgi:hypothetical protein
MVLKISAAGAIAGGAVRLGATNLLCAAHAAERGRQDIAEDGSEHCTDAVRANETRFSCH